VHVEPDLERALGLSLKGSRREDILFEVLSRSFFLAGNRLEVRTLTAGLAGERVRLTASSAIGCAVSVHMAARRAFAVLAVRAGCLVLLTGASAGNDQTFSKLTGAQSG